MTDQTPRSAATLSERITAARLQRGWSKSAVARHFGVNQSTTSRWEHDQLAVGAEHFPKMAEFLEITEPEVVALRYGFVPPEAAISELKDRLAQAERRIEALEKSSRQ